MEHDLNSIRYGHTSTVITTPDSYLGTTTLLTQLDWTNHGQDVVLVLGERKTSRITLLALSETDTAPPSMTIALERLSPSLDPSQRAGALTRDVFDVEILDLSDVPLTLPLAVRLSRLNVVSPGIPVLIDIGRNAVSRLREAASGFLGAVGMSHAGSGKAIFIEFFANRAALRESEVTAYFDARAARESGIMVEPPEHEVYQLYSLSPGQRLK